MIANFASTHQCRVNPQAVAAASAKPVNADALASGASRTVSISCAIDVAATRISRSSLVRPITSKVNSARACPIQPTEVTTCSHTVSCRQVFVRMAHRFARPPGPAHRGRP